MYCAVHLKMTFSIGHIIDFMTHILTEQRKTQRDSLQVLPNCPAAAADSNGPLIHKYFSAPDIFGEDAALSLVPFESEFVAKLSSCHGVS